MRAKPRHQMTKEPINEVEREHMDPNTWDWEKTEVGQTTDTPGAVIEVRFTRAEMLALNRIAQRSGIGPVEYMRQTMVRHLADHQNEGAAKHKRLA